MNKKQAFIFKYHISLIFPSPISSSLKKEGLYRGTFSSLTEMTPKGILITISVDFLSIMLLQPVHFFFFSGGVGTGRYFEKAWN